MSLLRRGIVLVACSALFALPACGGGGGGGGTSSAPVPITQTPTPAPAPTPTAAPPAQQTASLMAGQPATANFPAVATGVSGGVTVPAATAGAGTPIAAALDAALPAGTPALSAMRRRPQAIGASGIAGLGYITLTPAANVGFGATPGFTFAFSGGAGAITIAASTSAYVAVYDPTNAAAGWQTILGPQPVGGGTTSVTFAGSATPTALSAAKTYVYALFTAAGAVTVPTPTPAPTPTASPTPVISPAPGTSPSPAASPTPAAAQALPLVGAMPALGAGFGGITSASANGATVVGIGTHLLASGADPVTTQGSLTLSVNGKTSSLRRSPRAGAQSTAGLSVDAPTAAQYRIVRNVLRGATRGGKPVESVRRTRALPTTAGATAGLWAQNTAIGATTGGHYTQVPATLEAITAHGYIWVDTTLVSNGQVGTSEAQQIGADFENAWASDTAHFGTELYGGQPVEAEQASYCSASGARNGSGVAIVPSATHTVVFVVNPASLGGGVGGYFDPANFLPDAELQCDAGARAAGIHSNEAPMIYLGWFNPTNPDYELREDLVRGTAHEFQHLINFVDHALLNDEPSAFEDTFINEGLSMLAQDLAVPRMFPSLNHDVYDAMRHANQWLASPQSYSLTGFSGIDPGQSAEAFNCSGCYGGSFVFQRYLYDRLGGDAYLHQVESGTATGLDHIAAIAGESDAQLLTDFGIALAANTAGGSGASGRYALPGLPFGQSLPTQFAGRSVTVSPVGVANPTPGGGSFGGPYDGGYIFLSVPGAGSSISLSDSSNAIGLAAGIAQH